MRVIGGLLLFVVVLIIFNSCFDAPHFPPEPKIVFDNIIFKKGFDPKVTPADSLILTLKFTDGDGDLGLRSDEIYYPYHARSYYLYDDQNNHYFTDVIGNIDPKFHYVTGATKRLQAGTPNDTLPDFVTPYNCTNWEVFKDSVVNPGDTLVYFTRNKWHHNIFIDIFLQQADGSWKKYDWGSEFIYPNCQIDGFDGRFPVLSKDLSQNAAQEGTIRYSMRSVAWLYFFNLKNMYLEVTISDRALHLSNVLTTPTFTLQSILKN